MSDAYRTAKRPERGPLTFGEKVKAAFRGLRRLEPMLEIALSGMDERLPREERVRAAGALGGSATLEKVGSCLAAELDPLVKETLAYSFEEAYRRTIDYYDNSMSMIHTVAGSDAVRAERDAFCREARLLARSLIADGSSISQNAKEALQRVARDRPGD